MDSKKSFWLNHSSRHPLFRAAVITVTSLVVIVSCIGLVGWIVNTYQSNQAMGDFQNGIAREMNHLKLEGDELAHAPELIHNVQYQNIKELQLLIQKERVRRSIGLMGVTNAEGVIMSRTRSTRSVGDNVFITAPQGRVVANGRSVESIELSGFDPNQLLMTTGRPVTNDGGMVGALFTNYLMDDSFTVRFRDAYLPIGVLVLFYTKEYGIYGASFTSSEDAELIHTYINAHSDWIQNGKTDSYIKLNGTTYKVINTIFPGLEESPGGALLFIPRYDISVHVILGVSFITLMCFLYTALYVRRNRSAQFTVRYVVFVCASAAFILLCVHVSLLYFERSYFELTRNHFTLYNSTMRIQPDSGVYDVHTDQHFVVVVDAGDESINAVDFYMRFDPTLIEVNDLTLSSSTCMFVLEQEFNNTSGYIHGSCVLARSRDEKKSLPVAEVSISPRATGQVNIVFDDAQTHVYAEDGLGTDVLRFAQGGAYRFEDFPGPNLIAPIIFSPSHPNRSRWYNRRSATLYWRGLPGDRYAYVFDAYPTTTPIRENSTARNSVIVKDLYDGVSYFHIRSLSGGPVNHYKIQTDMVPPEILTISASQTSVSVGDVVRFEFAAQDSASGMQRNFYVDLGNHLFLPVGSTLYVPFDEEGERSVTVRAYDKAGNFTERSILITVSEK